FIDWMMILPTELEAEFEQELIRYEEEKRMPYITSIERRGLERGLERGTRQGLLEAIELDLEFKFGSEGLSVLPEISQLENVNQLREILRALKTVNNLSELCTIYRLDDDSPN
ncbi:MAG: hypothetical protein SAL07_11310, partial [Oscillatoria sp. PMC 1051.18]|nr:hypothetical protein [Oscillatoria sp. PMC 1051.18]